MRTCLITVIAALLITALPAEAQAACKCNADLFKCLVATSFDSRDTIPNMIKCFKNHKECVSLCPLSQCKAECRAVVKGAKAICKEKAATDSAKCGGAQKAACQKNVKQAKQHCIKEAKDQKRLCKLNCREQK